MNAAALTSTGNTRGGEQLQACTPAAGVTSQAAAGHGRSRRCSRGSLTPWACAGARQQVSSPGSKRFTAPPALRGAAGQARPGQTEPGPRAAPAAAPPPLAPLPKLLLPPLPGGPVRKTCLDMAGGHRPHSALSPTRRGATALSLHPWPGPAPPPPSARGGAVAAAR